MVMERSPHTLIGGVGANEFAIKNGVPAVPEDWLVTPFAEEELEQFKRSGELPGIRYCQIIKHTNKFLSRQGRNDKNENAGVPG
jgi:isoaspartyl peptidase/L-asparaginase-like protein (Ntn-hydrolase superfamily)